MNIDIILRLNLVISIVCMIISTIPMLNRRENRELIKAPPLTESIETAIALKSPPRQMKLQTLNEPKIAHPVATPKKEEKPSPPSPKQLWLGYDQLKFTQDPDAKIKLREDLERQVESLEKSEANADGITEISLLLAKEATDTRRMRELAEELKEKTPTKAEYYLAWAEYLENRDEEAQDRLFSIQNQFPLAAAALQLMKSSEAQEIPPFSDMGLSASLYKESSDR